MKYLLPILLFLGITFLLYKPAREYIKWAVIAIVGIFIYDNVNNDVNNEENKNKINSVNKNIDKKENEEEIVDEKINKINDKIKEVDKNIKESEGKLKEVSNVGIEVDLATEEADSVLDRVINNNTDNGNGK